MSVAIRKHLRDFIAIALLLVVGLASAYVIVQSQRLRLPLLRRHPLVLRRCTSTTRP